MLETGHKYVLILYCIVKMSIKLRRYVIHILFNVNSYLLTLSPIVLLTVGSTHTIF